MKILITGGAGFIGSHLAHELVSRGEKVTVIDEFNDLYDPKLKRENVAPHLSNPAYTLVEGDIRDSDKVLSLFEESRFDAVVHLAVPFIVVMANSFVIPNWIVTAHEKRKRPGFNIRNPESEKPPGTEVDLLLCFGCQQVADSSLSSP